MAGGNNRRRFRNDSNNNANQQQLRFRTIYPTNDESRKMMTRTRQGGGGQINNGNWDTNVLFVNRLCGNWNKGRIISLRDLVYAFNIAAQQEEDDEEHQVLDVFYPRGSPFAYLQMRSSDAAKRAKHRLDQSWLFDKYIHVQFGRKRSYECFLSNRTIPSFRVTFGQNNNGGGGRGRGTTTRKRGERERTSNNEDEGGGEEDEEKDKPEEEEEEETMAENEEKMRQNAFFAKMPLGVSRHLRPGTLAPSGYNNNYLGAKDLMAEQEADDREREVDRERAPESPVLVVTGIDSAYNDKMLTRYDLIMLFSCYGQVVDCDVYMRRRSLRRSTESSNNNELPPRPHALVQMRFAEQATRAMHALDYTWQMGRFLKVTYAREQSIWVSNEQIKQKYPQKRAATPAASQEKGSESEGKDENGSGSDDKEEEGIERKEENGNGSEGKEENGNGSEGKEEKGNAVKEEDGSMKKEEKGKDENGNDGKEGDGSGEKDEDGKVKIGSDEKEKEDGSEGTEEGDGSDGEEQDEEEYEEDENVSEEEEENGSDEENEKEEEIHGKEENA